MTINNNGDMTLSNHWPSAVMMCTTSALKCVRYDYVNLMPGSSKVFFVFLEQAH